MFYFSLPFLAAGLALAVFFPLASGMGGLRLEPGCDGLYSGMAWGVLMGLFSQPGLEKLSDIFRAVANQSSDNYEKKKDVPKKDESAAGAKTTPGAQPTSAEDPPTGK